MSLQATVDLLVTKFIPLLLLCGCTPYVSYMHLDETPLHNDGKAYDFICGGGEVQRWMVSGDLAACKDVRGGTMLKVDVRVRFESMED